MRASTKTAALVYLLLTLIVLGPALDRGLLFLLDMPWPATFQIADYTTFGFEPQSLLFITLSILNLIVPAWLLQKAVLLSVLCAGSFTTFLLSKYIYSAYLKLPLTIVEKAAYASGLIAIMNPFVFERLAAGQWIVLAGYAYTPFVLLTYLERGNTKRFWIAYALFPLISIHFWLLFSVIGALCLALYNRRELYNIVSSAHAQMWFLLLNFFWIVSLFSGNNQQAETLNRNQFAAFQTIADPHVGLLGNVLSLHGMWASHSSLLKDTNTFWFAYALCLLAASVWGIYATRSNKKAKRVADTAAVVGCVSFILALGYAHPVSRAILAPFSYLPLAATLRESAKAIGFIALLYAVWVPIGLVTLARSWGRTALTCAIVLHLLMMSGMFWGFNGTLGTHDYPSDWYVIAETIPRDSRALILPWQGYLELEFADNAYVANPARVFFPFEVVQSTSTGNQLLDEQGGELRQLLNSYIDQKVTYTELSQALAAEHKITHIIILKTGNWQRYQPLIDQAKSTDPKTQDFPEITTIPL